MFSLGKQSYKGTVGSRFGKFEVLNFEVHSKPRNK